MKAIISDYHNLDLDIQSARCVRGLQSPRLLLLYRHTYFWVYFSPIPFCTAGLAAMRSIHSNKCGNCPISSFVKPLRSQPLTHVQVPMSATEYLPFPLPAR